MSSPLSNWPRTTASPQATLVVLATTALILGLSVYVLCRPADTVRFLPPLPHADAAWLVQLSPLVANLPSFLHVYAFILFSAAVVRPKRRNLISVCVIWVAVEILFEVFQRPPTPIPEFLRALLGVGVYDPLDVLALLLGGIVAYASVKTITRRNQ